MYNLKKYLFLILLLSITLAQSIGCMYRSKQFDDMIEEMTSDELEAYMRKSEEMDKELQDSKNCSTARFVEYNRKIRTGRLVEFLFGKDSDKQQFCKNTGILDCECVLCMEKLVRAKTECGCACGFCKEGVSENKKKEQSEKEN